MSKKKKNMFLIFIMLFVCIGKVSAYCGNKLSVADLQGMLNNMGYNCGTVDGIAGSKTKACIKNFQSDNGLSVDGAVGPQTCAALGYGTEEQPTNTCDERTSMNDVELRYRITNIGYSGTKITFNGWALLHRTNNENLYVVINAIDENGRVLETKEANGSGMDLYQEFCRKSGGKCKCSNSYGPASCYTCNPYERICGSEQDDCKYANLGFSVSFDAASWGVDADDEVHFEISVSASGYFIGPQNLGVDAGVSGGIGTLHGGGIIKVEKTSNAGTLMVREGIFNKSSLACGVRGETYEIVGVSSGSNTSSGYYTIIRSTNMDVDRIGKHGDTSCVNAYYAPSFWESGTYQTIHASWLIPDQNPFTIKVLGKKCDVVKPTTDDKLNCNGNKKFKSVCKELTVMTSQGSANVKITETATISNLLTPNKLTLGDKKILADEPANSLFAGGGFKFAFIYKNTVKWEFVNNSYCTTIECINAIKAKMASKVKTKEDFEKNFKLKSVNFNVSKSIDKYIPDVTEFTTKCSETGDFKEGSTTITCIISLPNPNLEDFTGNINPTKENNVNINNKHYTPISISKDLKYKMEATFSGLDRLDEREAKKDSKTVSVKWSGSDTEWSSELNGDSCIMNVYPFYQTGSKYNFMYRPIDHNNPFPDRKPGFNWNDWWYTNGNPEKLRNTYEEKYLQYSANLDNNKIIKIKGEMEKTNYNYLSWKGINPVTEKSDFVREYCK